MTTRLSMFALVVLLATISSASARAAETAEQGAEDSVAKADPMAISNGFSGLAQVDATSFLAVHDNLVYEDGRRLTLIRVEAGVAPTFSQVTVDNWVDPGGQSSDLESICAIPSRPNHFILAEAGYWETQYGRLFHIHLDAQLLRATVLGATKLPMFRDNNPEQTGDQFEGLECADAGEDSILLLLGERGGSDSYPMGRLRWGELNLATYALSFTPYGEQGIELNAPGRWTDSNENRDISALHLDPDGTLWAAAAEDPGDLGPFHSVIYQIGNIRTDLEDPIEINQTIDIWNEVPGFKIEALSGPSTAIPGSTLSFGTEDELHGGVLRFL